MIGKEVNVTVSADFGGKSQNLGGTKFRILKVPQPIINIGSISGGNVSASAIVNNPVVAKKTDGFAYDMSWKVSGFNYQLGSGKNKKSGTVNGNRFPGDLITAINNAEPGTSLLIFQVRVSATIEGKPVNIKIDEGRLGIGVSIK